ncbi:hypothetical protein AJ78_02541 [Emergomyces pasteurianus Ep9510]|uniref:NDT80 domain-containing protein n=1 Tax=Emergomyces pasteurianus Ep9510 TaxID=1447872 RepID=A0A1J9QNB8_9EURO|nr:hypothetical protein AJ78_02541 [Emergomyces pasteurianus Ep9510]
MTFHSQNPQYIGPHQDRYGYASEQQYQFEVPPPQVYSPYFEQWPSQHDGVHPACHLNLLVGLAASDSVGEGGARELPCVGDDLMGQAVIQPPRPNSDPGLSNTVFHLFGNSFPECNSMADMYCPRFQVYPGTAVDASPEFDLGFQHDSLRVVHVDITKSWKGLSSDKAEELLFWEATFRRALEYLLRDKLDVLRQQHEIKTQILDDLEQQQLRKSDRIHYLPISMIDIATAMVSSYREHRRMYRWLVSMGNIYRTIAQFVRTHDCFISPTMGMSSLQPGDLKIGVKLLHVNDYLQGKPNHLSGYPVEVNWAPDMLSFEQFDPITAEGQKLCLVPRYNSSIKFMQADGILEPHHIIYKTSSPWLRWDASLSGFSGTVPFYSDSEEQMMYPEVPLVGDASGEQSKIYTLRIMIIATAQEYFDSGVRFEKTVRARVTINVKRRKFPQPNSALHYTLGLVGPDNRKYKGPQSSPEWDAFQRPSPEVKLWDDPFIGTGRSPDSRAVEQQMRLEPSGRYKTLDDSRVLSRHLFDSFTGRSLLMTNMHTGLSALSDDDHIGRENDMSPPALLDCDLRVPPLRRQRRPSQNLNPLKLVSKLGSTVPPQMKTDHLNHPRTESGDTRLRHDIVNMLGMQLQCSHNDEDLEMMYRPWRKRSYWRGTGLPAQMKGNGYLGQGRRLPKNAKLSKENTEEEDKAYISKYCWKTRLASDQRQRSSSEGRPEYNISRTPSSEPLTMGCSLFLNSHKVTRAECESVLDLPWTPPASDICPSSFEERRMLGSDIGDVFDPSPAHLSEDDWEGIDTDEEGVSIPDERDSDEEQPNEGVPIPIPGSSIESWRYDAT